MRIDILTGLPMLLESPFRESILKRAQESGKATIVVHNLREYASDKHRTIDDTPYGGGAGMILKPEPVFACVDALRAERPYDEIILMTPSGEPFTQQIANRISLLKQIIVICGHYKGIDERIRDALVSKEISIGDYVLTGGELAAAVLVDAVVRLLPGAMGDGESLLSDSFQDGLLDCAYYTRPPEFRGMKVPEVLLSGNHAEIGEWRREESMKKTRERRPDLLGEPE